MKHENFSQKVRAVRDAIIDCIRDLSCDKENLFPNIKMIKELTGILKEIDRIDERDQDADNEVKQERLLDFFQEINQNAIVKKKITAKRKNKNKEDNKDE